MQSAAPTSTESPDGYSPELELMALVEQTLRMIAVTEALVASHRHVDLEGLEHHVGLICAKALDLAPGQTGLMKIELRQLLHQFESLDSAMRQNAA